MNTRLARPAGFFIAGTDTGVGKTRVSAALIQAFRGQDLHVGAMKPIAAGAVWQDNRWINTDAVTLAASSLQKAPYELVNPYCLAEPIAPHIAAKMAGIRIEIGLIQRCFQQLAMDQDLVVVEGAGGWLTPISEHETMADVACALEIPIVLVVGLRLGCLNHALLTAASIAAHGCSLAGWIGSQVDAEFAALAGNLLLLEQRLGAPPLALLPHLPDRATDSERLREAAAALARRSRHSLSP